MKTVRIVVTGRVQGVGFRFFVVDAARQLGVVGYTRNLPSRQHVEVVASGSEQQLDTLLSLLRTGPSEAHVDGLQMTEVTDSPAFDQFSIDW